MEIQPGIREDITLRSRKDNYMISEYREIENEYINIFSVHENCSGYERFYDDKLPGTSWGNRDVYKSVDNNLEAYIAYFDGEPAGKCELFIQDGYAKIEDFDVVKKHQRKGIGTTMLRSMIEDAISREVRNIYLIADKDDTPRDMYSRLGFETIGEEIELFRALNG